MEAIRVEVGHTLGYDGAEVPYDKFDFTCTCGQYDTIRPDRKQKCVKCGKIWEFVAFAQCKE